MGMFSALLADMPERLGEFTPYPDAGDRNAWTAAGKSAGQRIIKEAEQYIGYAFAPMPAVLYMDLCRTGNRSRYENLYFTRRTVLNVLVLAECIEYKGRFTDSIINGIFALCEESGWQLPAHNSYIRDTPQLPLPDYSRPILDLFACETGCQLSMIHYLLHDRLDEVSPVICGRIRTELEHRMFIPYLKEKFWWMGYNGEATNNWTVWCTQNVLISSFLPGICGPEHTDKTERFRRLVLKRAAYSIDRFLAGYGEDGCCSEGAQYYRHAGLCLFNAMEVLSAVSGGLYGTLYKNRKIRNIAEYIVNIHASGKYYINYADCAAVAGPAGIREYLFGRRCGSDVLAAFAASDIRRTAAGTGVDPYVSNETERLNLFYLVQELFTAEEALSYSGKTIAPVSDIAYKSTGLFISRDDSYCLAVKAGGNGDSHNHNDTGSIILYKDGRPFIIDIGVETYSQKTFSSRRYEIWTMQSQYHNVTNFGSVMQEAGPQFHAEKIRYHPDEKKTSISMELCHTYPAASGLVSYLRSVIFTKGKKITVADTVSGSPAQPVLTLMTQNKPVILPSCKTDHSAKIQVDAIGTIDISSGDSISVTIETVPVTDARLRLSWPDTIYRILIQYESSITVVLK